jgi:hypothetical protein
MKPAPSKSLLLVCGSFNQTTMMHKIGVALEDEYRLKFTPFYCTGMLEWVRRTGLLNNSIVAGRMYAQALKYLNDHGLPLDIGAKNVDDYDAVVICTDLILPDNIRKKPIILVQEGMTDPENFAYYLVKYLKFPRWIASTSTTGLSDAYTKFCVASEGYRELFVKKGVKPEKLVVTGIPNFDDVAQYLANDFPHKGYVLAATSDMRETFKRDDRPAFLKHCKEIAAGRPLFFKLHPNERYDRAKAEIDKYCPGAQVFQDGNTNHMIANCEVLITQYSTVSYVGLGLGKKVHSYFDVDELKRLQPIQNGGTSARKIAEVIRSEVSA